MSRLWRHAVLLIRRPGKERHVCASHHMLYPSRNVNISVGDTNHEGIPDLIAEFPNGGVRLSARATLATLTGWLKNSRAFFGSDEVVVVPGLAMPDPSCR